MRPAAAPDPAYELGPHAPAPAEAVEAAEGGEVVYLTRNGQRFAALVPPEVAAVGLAAVVALEDAADVRDARTALAEDGESVPAEQLWAELGL